jgi:ABC-type uncharacterized transport system auxiliary subunit
MRTTTTIICLAIFAVMSGCSSECSTPKRAYKINTKVSPAEEQGQYCVEFTLEDVSAPDGPKVLSSPRVTVLQGEKGRVFVGDTLNNIDYSVIINKLDKGLEANTAIAITEKGTLAWSAQQTIQLPA